MRDTIFFDLDGTLLPLDMDDFFGAYNEGAHQSGVFELISPEDFGKAVYTMIGNDGQMTNKECFFGAAAKLGGAEPEVIEEAFNAFYKGAFLNLKKHTRTEIKVGEVVRIARQKGYRMVLATQPLFPEIATDKRIEWAGLKRDDFEYVSYYHNSHYCKPNPKYFEEIMGKIGVTADRCYIVGNDVKDDMCAVKLGFEGFLVLDHAVGDVSEAKQCKKGGYSDLLRFAESLPQI